MNYCITESMIKAREKSGLSRKELSEASGLHIGLIYMYESGRSTPGLYNLIAMADALGVSIDEYIGRGAEIRKARNGK